jgi:hypothetical protein
MSSIRKGKSEIKFPQFNKIEEIESILTGIVEELGGAGISFRIRVAS